MEDIDSQDNLIVRRVSQGNTKAFELLVLKYQNKVANVIISYIKDPEEVADLAQEVFLRAFRALGTFSFKSNFYTWLHRITINVALSYLKQKSKMNKCISGENIDDLSSDEPSFAMYDSYGVNDNPAKKVQDQSLLTFIDDVIATLPDDLRTALILREHSGLGYEEIAQIMNCPVGTVRSRIFRAREFLESKIMYFKSN